MNVVLISFDTLRPDHLGCYGYGRDTSPNIDKLARESVVFTQAISPSPWTSPAHYSLFTSLNPSVHRNEGFRTRRFLPAKTLASALKDHGYYTAAITGGGCVSALYGFGDGFDTYTELMTPEKKGPLSPVNTAETIFTEGMRWLENNVDTKFFLFLHTYECHIPYEHAFFLPKDGESSLIERRKALYDGDIRFADFHFGRFMRTLRSLDLMKNTIVVFLSDHGEDFYDHYRESDLVPPYTEQVIAQYSEVDHGHSLYEELIRVPLIFYIPGSEAAGNVVHNQVRLIDVMPTVLDILNIHIDDPLQGVSLRELLRNTEHRWNERSALSEFTDIGPERKSIRADGYKYVWTENPDVGRLYKFKEVDRYELFDLKLDPEEKQNIQDHNVQLARKYHKMLEDELASSRMLRHALRQRHEFAERRNEDMDEHLKGQLKALGYLH